MATRMRSDEIARARLAFISADGAPVQGARRGAEEPAVDLPPPETSATAWGGRFTRRHVAAVVLLLAICAGIALMMLNFSSAQPLAVPEVEQLSQAPEPEPVPPSPSPSAEGLIRVHVIGAVRSPGVVSLPQGSIVQDAIAAAGGLSDDADPAMLNLAAPLSSGQQVVVGTVEEPLGELRDAPQDSGADPGSGGLVNINTATAAELEALPGVGPVLAAAIVEWRETNGGFTAVEDLQEVSGIGPKSFAKLAPLVTV